MRGKIEIEWTRQGIQNAPPYHTLVPSNDSVPVAAEEHREERQRKPRKEENTGVKRNSGQTIACPKTFSHVLKRCSKDPDSRA